MNKPTYEELVDALTEYQTQAPAFRTRQIGAAGSLARERQDKHIALEDRTRALIARARSAPL